MSDGFPDRVTQLKARWQADPTSRIFLQLAEEYRHLGRLRDALEVLDAGLREHPGYLSALVARGRCLLELGEAEAAREVLERVVHQDVTQMVASKLLVRAYLELGDAEHARQRLDLYCLLNDGDPEIEDLKRRVEAMNRPSPAEEPLPPAPLNLEGEDLDEPFSFAAGQDSRRGDVFDLDSSQRGAEGPSQPLPAAPDPSANEDDPFPELTLTQTPHDRVSHLAAEGIFAFERPSEVVFELDSPPPPSIQTLPPDVPPVGEDGGETWTGPWEMEPEPHVPEPAADAPEGSAFTVAEWAPEPPPEREESGETPGAAGEALPAPQPSDFLSSEEPAAPAPATAAAPSFEAVPPAEPAAPNPATATLGQLYRRQGHTSEAERIFRAVLERDPDNAVARAELARITGAVRPLEARDLLAGGPEGGTAKAKKLHLLKNYLQLLRRASRNHVP